MISFLKKVIAQQLTSDHEFKYIENLLDKNIDKSSKILDVGCGYGRLLIPFHKKGYDIIGIDVNTTIKEFHLKNGRKCLHPSELSSLNQEFDLVIMSHIIEHFEPNEMFDFMNKYLARIKNNGCLLIATPLQSPYFYDDFDHKRPYNPESIIMAFGTNASQLKFESNEVLKLKTLWFRKNPYFLTKKSYMYFKDSPRRYFGIFWNLLVQLLFMFTGKRIGRKDGWVGLFQKNPEC